MPLVNTETTLISPVLFSSSAWLNVYGFAPSDMPVRLSNGYYTLYKIGIEPTVEEFPLADANEVLLRIKHSELKAAAILCISGSG